MKNKKIIRIIILLYIVLLFAYPYILGRNVSDINGSLPFFDKIAQNTNLIPFNFNYDINLDIIVKNVALTPYWSRISKILVVFGLGPSSNVR